MFAIHVLNRWASIPPQVLCVLLTLTYFISVVRLSYSAYPAVITPGRPRHLYVPRKINKQERVQKIHLWTFEWACDLIQSVRGVLDRRSYRPSAAADHRSVAEARLVHLHLCYNNDHCTIRVIIRRSPILTKAEILNMLFNDMT